MTDRRLFRIVFPAALLAFLMVAGPSLRKAEAVELAAAWADLEELKRSTKSKASNDDIDQYLDAVFNAFKGLDGPTPPADDASDEEKEKYKKDLATFEDQQRKFRDEAEKVILKIHTLVKVKNDVNLRDDMNTKAARILGQLGEFMDEKGRKELSKKLMQAIEKRMTKVKTHRINTDHLDATFEALGKLDDHDTIDWLLKNYTHTNENEKEYLIAAHKAFLLFQQVEGKVRYNVVETFVKVYAGVEAQAEQSSSDPKLQAKKRFWDDIKTGVIPVVQQYSKDADGNPAAGEDGQALAKMAEFQNWIRDHKSLRKAPWVEKEKKEEKKEEKKGDAAASK